MSYTLNRVTVQSAMVSKHTFWELLHN